jgi:hypothetical protein
MGLLMTLLAMTAAPALADLDAGAGSMTDAIRSGSTGFGTTDNDGDADSDSGTTYTEDNDTNDGTANNVADDGDNAHPSGKDRSVENGGSGTQGKAESNPDDSKGPQRYEGARGDDKANGPGGKDLADQDGNNGCGNDDDFDDDNNGWCGKPHDQTASGNSCSENGNSGWECTGGTSGAVGGSSTGGCPNEKMGGDDTGHGANQGTVYDSTCDGSPSLNGNGKGNASGRPCAGCVGNADDKNPPGQMPGGSDNNKGYECDENSGVGRTNPAHTGCTAPLVGAAAITLCPAGTDMAGQPEGPRGCDTEDEVLGRSDKVCPAGTDNAGKQMDADDCDQDDSVLGTMLHNAGPLGTALKKTASVLGAVLPFTGNGDIVALLVIAAALIVGGVLLLARKKRTP